MAKPSLAAVKPETCDTCQQPWHDTTDHEPNHTYTAKELLELATEVVVWHLNGACCGVKSEITTEKLDAEARFCPFCGYESGSEEDPA